MVQGGAVWSGQDDADVADVWYVGVDGGVLPSGGGGGERPEGVFVSWGQGVGDVWGCGACGEFGFACDDDARVGGDEWFDAGCVVVVWVVVGHDNGVDSL